MKAAMKVALILGTRPEIIKLSPVIRELQHRKADFFILHTGQHYTDNLTSIFFEEIELPRPEYNLNVGSGTHTEETGKMLIGIGEILAKDRPDVVLVEGDTNSVLAGALAAAKLHIRVGHVEAGLRSYDRRMPEELNRILCDHLADYLFAPTGKARSILLGEGIPEEKIIVAGNTIVDAVHQNLAISDKKSRILSRLGLKERAYFLVTLHREENVDNRSRLQSILKGLGLVFQQFGQPLVYPGHPRTRRRIDEFKLVVPAGVRLIEPLGFLDFLALEGKASLVLTDSGGVQEESCILKVPCVTLRDNTERPETLEVGGNTLAGAEPGRIVDSAERMLSVKRTWANPFGDGRAAIRILDTISGTEPSA